MSEAALVGWILIGLGAIGVAVGVFLLVRRRAFLATAVTVQGTVVQLVESSGEDGPVFSRVVQYTTADGRQVTFQESMASNMVKETVGSPITVRYQTDRPDKAVLGAGFGTWFWPAFPLLVGLGLLIPGVIALVTSSDPEDPPAIATPSIPGFTPPAFTTPPTLPPATRPGGTTVGVSRPTGSGAATATCVGISDSNGGTVREVELDIDGDDTVVFRMEPYTGPGSYIAGDTVTVTGTFFEGATDPASGAMIVDATGQAGSINLNRGNYSISGPWSCEGVDADG